MKNFYDELQVSEAASLAEIKKAYRTLAKQFHPDLNKDPGSAEKFIAIEEAYSCLSNNHSRVAYDKLLRFKRENFVHATVQRKYENDVNQRASAGRSRGTSYARMNYSEFKQHDWLIYSSSAVVIQTVFVLISGILLAILFYQIAVALFGPKSSTWSENKGIFVLAACYILSLIGLTYLYEPLVKFLITSLGRKRS